MKYYSIDDILVNEQTTKVKFQHTLKLLTKKLSKNKKHELPLFLTTFFIENEHCTLTDLLTEQEKNDLLANPSDFKFNKEYTLRIMKMLNADFPVEDVFLERIREYLKLVYEAGCEESDLEKLDVVEKRILKKARNMFNEFANH